MVQAIPANTITLRTLKQHLGLEQASDANFFSEWTDDIPKLNDLEQQTLDRVKANVLDFLDDPPVLENSVKLVVLSPLLDLAGFYRRPFRIKTETSIDIAMEDEGITIRGRIDILVVNETLWLVVVESKRSDFAVTRAVPQALAYMLGNPEVQQPTFGMITNGSDFLFLKSLRTPSPRYATSRLLSLINPQNELYDVLAILKRLSQT
ncbi:MAG: type I restriction endonuclease [Elainellaceae cyanobacterium]